MMAITPKSLVFFVIVLLFVGCTVLMMQGMLPNIGLGPLGDSAARVDPDLGPAKSKVGSYHTANKMSVDMLQVNLLDKPLPDGLDAVAKGVKVVDKHLRALNRDIFYREALPPDNVAHSQQSVVLLHGMNFKSLTWLELNTINLLAAMGHRVVAFDLPGFGETGGEKLDNKDKADFLNNAFQVLHLTDPVIVSPSMSGSYSLTYLFKFPGQMGGYVPVAPVFTEKHTKEEYQTVMTPTLIIYGEADELLGAVSTANLKNIPNSQVQMLEKARHSAYLDQPKVFHTLLYNFLLNLKI